MNNNNLEILQMFLFVSVNRGFMSIPLTYALAKVPFYKYIPVVILFILPTHLYIMT